MIVVELLTWTFENQPDGIANSNVKTVPLGTQISIEKLQNAENI